MIVEWPWLLSFDKLKNITQLDMLVEQTLQAISKKKKKKRANEDKETLILKAQKIKDMLQGFKG